MSKITTTAKLDVKGSELSKYSHYVFGKLGANLSGGFYLAKGSVLPDEIVIELPEKEKEGEKDAERKGY